MKRFLNGSPAAYADLERRAKTAAYINFPGAELPPGCVPPTTRIGVKVEQTTATSILYVELGIRYYGADATIRRWLEAGELAFPTFEALRTWLTGDLKRIFETSVAIQVPAGEAAEASLLPSAPCAHVANPSPAAPAPSPSETPAATPRPTSPPPTPAAGGLPAGAPSTSPVLGRLVELVVRQLGAKHGLDVRIIDPALSALLIERLQAGDLSGDPERIVEDALGGALSLAAIQGHAAVSVHAGPPVTCMAIPNTKPDA